MEELDQGREIRAVKTTVDECVEWFNANPDMISSGVVCRVEANTEPIYFALLPELVVATQFNYETRKQEDVTKPMALGQMSTWLHEEGKKHPYYKVGDWYGGRHYQHMWMGESAEAAHEIAGQKTVITVKTRTVLIDDCPIKV